MTQEVENLMQWTLICVFLAALFTTLFPILYAFVPWYRTPLGRSLMIQAITLAIAVDGTLLLQFWTPENLEALIWFNAAVFTALAGSSAYLTWKMFKHNFIKPYKEKKAMSNTENPETPATHPLLSNHTYDQLKNTVTLVLPAIGALYFALAAIWGLPKAEEVVGSVAAITTFFGVVLKLSDRAYNKSDEKYDGTMNVVETEVGKTMSLELNKDPELFEAQDQVLFKVNQL